MLYLKGVTSTPRSVSRNSIASTAGGNCSSSAAGDAEEGGGSGAPKTRINIVLLGKAGNGKSSFGNFLLNSQVFSITPGTECELKEVNFSHYLHLFVLKTKLACIFSGTVSLNRRKHIFGHHRDSRTFNQHLLATCSTFCFISKR